MKSILVTGANKGIGLAIVEAILREQPHYRVIMGSRNGERGEKARQALLDADPSWSDRIGVIELDVSNQQSVANAVASFSAQHSDNSPPLYGLVNNAGVGSGTLEEALNVNVLGIRRVCDGFAPLLETGGRIVNVTSASGPNFVARCNDERQDFFRDSAMTWERLEQFMTQCLHIGTEDLVSLGMGSDSPYGLSKACANSYTLYLARCHPQLLVNACTPGFIETDLAKEFLGQRTPAEAGMKSPAEGARVVMTLLFGQPRATGHYYGSDGLRSPLDSYRAPGSPEYSGD
jgi:NAD(P)-dependent dehydrogenase (short-subunit alcohol dehydrogenase family)